jgi:hypothetical protein
MVYASGCAKTYSSISSFGSLLEVTASCHRAIPGGRGAGISAEMCQPVLQKEYRRADDISRLPILAQFLGAQKTPFPEEDER